MTPLTNNQLIELAESEGSVVCESLDRETGRKDSVETGIYILDEGEDHVCVELDDTRNFTIQRNDEPFKFEDEDFNVRMFAVEK